MNRHTIGRPTLEVEQYYWDHGFLHVVGVDEVGRGPLAGPVVAAAVMFPPHTFIEGVDDSKKLSEEERENLLQPIVNAAISVGLGVVDHQTIDNINILKASHVAMRIAINSLRVKPDIILVDGRGFGYDVVRCENIIDGDARVFSIAAASIVAKVHRDRIMRDLDRLYPQYGFAKHKGYATKEHLEALRVHGMCPVHRRSFKLHFIHESHRQPA
jgi:ribonuclease HII